MIASMSSSAAQFGLSSSELQIARGKRRPFLLTTERTVYSLTCNIIRVIPQFDYNASSHLWSQKK